uniref:Uncharacterized protein n=1 Tax=Amphimedon queenslandica TaxID=400682 RepID=A0A1X7VM62_AMPQE
MDDDSNEVFCSDSEDHLGFEDEIDECNHATDSMIDDDVVNTTIDAGPGTEHAASLLLAGDMELSSHLHLQQRMNKI